MAPVEGWCQLLIPRHQHPRLHLRQANAPARVSRSLLPSPHYRINTAATQVPPFRHSEHPKLIEQRAVLWVVDVVADSLGDEVDGAQRVERHCRSLVDDRAVYPCPGLARGRG